MFLQHLFTPYIPPRCSKKRLSGFNYPRSTRAGQAAATPEPLLSFFHPFLPSPAFCLLLHAGFVAGRVILLLPGPLGICK